VVCLRIAILVKELFLRCSTKKTKHEKVLHIPDGIGSSTLELSILSELSRALRGLRTQATSFQRDTEEKVSTLTGQGHHT